MIKKNKIKFILSLLVTILPMIIGLCFWGRISDGNTATLHSVKITSVFIIPSFMLLLNGALTAYAAYDYKRNVQHEKIITVSLFIVPTISLYASSIFYAILLGWNINIQFLTSLLFGVLFMILGNYMPKSKQNRTFGLKIRWTLANEDNWIASHRLAGKVWVITGFAILLSGFLPQVAFFIVFLSLVILATVIPVVYSYRYYKNNVKSGKQSEADYNFAKRSQDKAVFIVSIIAVSVICVFVLIIMFTGNIEVNLSEESMEIEATFHADETIKYSDITAVEYRENADKGKRVMGFGSPRLLMGTFKNDEFGAFTRFSYTKCESDIIVTVGENKIAISQETEEATRELYESLLKKING